TKKTSDISPFVILSDCKVKPSPQPKGDHIPSLSRGLFHYGANTVLISLWKMPEESNAALLPSFAKQLRKGKSKAKALQICNQSFLKKENTAQNLAPSHWAAYLLIGNTDAVTKRNWYWLSLAIIPLSWLWYQWRKRRKKKRIKEIEVTTTMEY
ncbi:MAG TPA: CHAT domain-containing protein, partial [Phaeodactylibacter sp.]|nr:CHAT domain-containing protein [Phaeodactylibacter sp.]